MSSECPATPFVLTPPPLSQEEERNARKAAKQRAYYEANREKVRESQKVYYQKNREKMKAASIAYYQENRAHVSARAKMYYQENRDRISAYNNAWRKANPEQLLVHRRTYNLKRVYKLTIKQKDAMIAAQGNRCLCCKTPFGLLRLSRPQVDHCHATGRVRGILCGKCNLLLGHADDSADTLRTCARYLE